MIVIIEVEQCSAKQIQFNYIIKNKNIIKKK
jgi:hypothetical protein